MRNTDFGWSLPPGCSDTPDTDESPCVLCGNFSDDCTCPECQYEIEPGQICGVVGCVEHFPDRQLVALIRSLDGRLYDLNQERIRREKSRPITCRECGAVQHANLMAEGCSVFCKNCEADLGDNPPESLFDEE